MRNLKLLTVSRLTVAALSLVTYLAGCGGTDAPLCQTSSTPQAVTDYCAPVRIAANQMLRLQVREQCGGCTQHATRCEVTVQGTDVKLSLLGETCMLAPNTACPAICSTSVVDCNVPALAAGTYRVSATAGTSTIRMMTTDNTISATACSVP